MYAQSTTLYIFSSAAIYELSEIIFEILAPWNSFKSLIKIFHLFIHNILLLMTRNWRMNIERRGDDFDDALLYSTLLYCIIAERKNTWDRAWRWWMNVHWNFLKAKAGQNEKHTQQNVNRKPWYFNPQDIYVLAFHIIDIVVVVL